MHLIEGAKWSDGVPFTATTSCSSGRTTSSIPTRPPLNGATPETFGAGTTLVKVDDYTRAMDLQARPSPTQYLYQMAYGIFCPGPAHILKPQHPKYNTDNTYDDVSSNAFPPEYLNYPGDGRLGAGRVPARTTSW